VKDADIERAIERKNRYEMNPKSHRYAPSGGA
jgi:hypothetical protein